MKKKNLLFIAGGIFIAVALAAMLLFVFSGDENGESEAVSIKLDGAWKVVAYIQAGTTNIPEQEYFVFSGDTANAYRNDKANPYATSTYTFTAGTYPNWELNLPDISRKYTVSVVTDNYIRLYENSSVYMELIRYANNDLSDLDFTEDVVVGKWNVVYRNTSEVIADEILNFNDGILDDYRNGGSEPVASVPYYWDENGYICVDALNAKMRCYPLSDEVIIFVEAGTGYVWELHASE